MAKSLTQGLGLAELLAGLTSHDRSTREAMERRLDSIAKRVSEQREREAWQALKGAR
jgi:hypothetical protein